MFSARGRRMQAPIRKTPRNVTVNLQLGKSPVGLGQAASVPGRVAIAAHDVQSGFGIVPASSAPVRLNAAMTTNTTR